MLRTVPYQLGTDGAPDPPKLRTRRRRSPRSSSRRATAPTTVRSSSCWTMSTEPQLAHQKTDMFREQVAYSNEVKDELAAARATKTADAVRAVERRARKHRRSGIGDRRRSLLSYRAVEAWDDMIALVAKMARPLARHRHGPRAARPRAQPPRPARRGRACSHRVGRGARPEQRDARHPRPRLQGPLGRRQQGRRRVARAAFGRRSTPTCAASRPTGATPIPASMR